MNPLQFYSHLVLAHRPAALEERRLAEEVKEHFRKTLSVDTVVMQLRERLARRRAREHATIEVARLEREVTALTESGDPRVEELRARVASARKELEKKMLRETGSFTSPLP
jgi:hypothetical protein